MKKILCLSFGLISSAPLFGMLGNNMPLAWAAITASQKNNHDQFSQYYNAQPASMPVTFPVDDTKAKPGEVFIKYDELTPIQKLFYRGETASQMRDAWICRDNDVTRARSETFRCQLAKQKAVAFEKSKNDNKETFLRYYKDYSIEYEARERTIYAANEMTCWEQEPPTCIVYNGSNKGLLYLSACLCCTYETTKCPLESAFACLTCCSTNNKPCNYDMTKDALDNLKQHHHNAVIPAAPNVMQ